MSHLTVRVWQATISPGKWPKTTLVVHETLRDTLEASILSILKLPK